MLKRTLVVLGLRPFAQAVITLTLLGYSAIASSSVVTLSTSAVGRFANHQISSGYISVGQGQAGWQAFDISGLSVPVSSISYSFTLRGATNAHGFPLSMAIYDVNSEFTDLNISQTPPDAAGLALMLDLHSGNTYGNFIAYPVNDEVYTVNFNAQAIADLNSSIGLGEQYFSIGIANTSFEELGYFSPMSATLTVSEVPIPAAAWLFGSALIGLVGFKRKQ